MALTSRITKDIQHPSEEVRVTIRKLSHHQLMMAVDANEGRVTDKFARLGEAARNLPQADPASKAKAEEEAKRPENRYERTSVLQSGITSWTYDVPPDPTTINDLDEETAVWLFEEIIAFSVRGDDEVKPSASDSPPSLDPAVLAGRAS